VLVGPNNAGKSNLVDAFAFLADIYRDGVARAIEARGGLAELPYRKGRAPWLPISFDFDVTLLLDELPDYRSSNDDHRLADASTLKSSGATAFLRHSLTLVVSGRPSAADSGIQSESLTAGVVTNGEHQVVFQIDRSVLQSSVKQPNVSRIHPALVRQFWFSERGPDIIEETFLPPTDLIVHLLRGVSPIVRYVVDKMAQVRIYRSNPLACRDSGKQIATSELASDGKNLAALVQFLKTEHHRAWDRVRQALVEVAPELDDVKVEADEDGRLALRFVESGVNRPWTATQISDGTIRMLSLFGALYDPRWPVQIVEEPENSAHPWAIRVFADACRDATQHSGKQILVTTHSPVLIDYVRPEDIFLVWREDGSTLVSPLTERDPQAASMWADGVTTISGLLDSGWLRESVLIGAD
jgi:predicted ATPase